MHHFLAQKFQGIALKCVGSGLLTSWLVSQDERQAYEQQNQFLNQEIAELSHLLQQERKRTSR